MKVGITKLESLPDSQTVGYDVTVISFDTMDGRTARHGASAYIAR